MICPRECGVETPGQIWCWWADACRQNKAAVRALSFFGQQHSPYSNYECLQRNFDIKLRPLFPLHPAVELVRFCWHGSCFSSCFGCCLLFFLLLGSFPFPFLSFSFFFFFFFFFVFPCKATQNKQLQQQQHPLFITAPLILSLRPIFVAALSLSLSLLSSSHPPLLSFFFNFAFCFQRKSNPPFHCACVSQLPLCGVFVVCVFLSCVQLCLTLFDGCIRRGLVLVGLPTSSPSFRSPLCNFSLWFLFDTEPCLSPTLSSGPWVSRTVPPASTSPKRLSVVLSTSMVRATPKWGCCSSCGRCYSPFSLFSSLLLSSPLFSSPLLSSLLLLFFLPALTFSRPTPPRSPHFLACRQLPAPEADLDPRLCRGWRCAPPLIPGQVPVR